MAQAKEAAGVLGWGQHLFREVCDANRRRQRAMRIIHNYCFHTLDPLVIDN